MLSDADLALFRNAMQGVKPLHSKSKADVGKSLLNYEQIKIKRLNAVSGVHNYLQDDFSDHLTIEVNSNDELYFAKNGVALNQISKLKKGQINYQSSIDLHGFTVDEARCALNIFLTQSIRHNFRVVRVIHGKAIKHGNFARLKSYINSWLRVHKQVLAFCSCLQKHGGTGAVYVMLQRNFDKNNKGKIYVG